MKGPGGMLIMILLILAGVAFLNHGTLGFGTTPSGSSFNAGFKGASIQG
jgi:hypothetical protein